MINENSEKKTNEQIKNEVLIDLYNSGRIQGNYFGIKSKSKANPIKGYINKFLGKNNIDDVGLQLCDECYQTIFKHLWAKSADKIVEIINVSPSKLTATALRIAIAQCFSIKPNSKSSGIFHNILSKSSYGSDQISTMETTENEDGDNSGKPLILVDENENDDFTETYGFTVEDVVARMNDDDREFFYYQMETQKVGKPSKSTVQQREALYKRIIEIKHEIENDR